MNDVSTNKNPDESFFFMQNFYAKMNGLAKQIMFIPMINILFSFSRVRTVQMTILNGENVDFIGDSIEKLDNFMPNTRRRLEKIKCERCIKVNWANLWCGDGFCRVADENGLLLFVDEHHCSLYGSLFVGKYLHKLYLDYTEINQN
jgi:hypothetical protein